MKHLAACIFMATSVAVSVAQSSTGTACSNISLGQNGALNGFVPSPNDAWHADISAAPVDPNSTNIMTLAQDLGSLHLHPDFGSVVNGNYGIPYTVVDTRTTPTIPLPISLYGSDSDITLYPLTPSTPVEGAPAACPTDGNDRHALVIDRNKCVVYELYQANYCKSAWSASSSAIWDMTTTEQRPFASGSADAAGLSVFAGLLRYDEIVAGQVNHAIRFTAVHTKSDANNGFFTAPATHAAGTLWGTDNIMGMRVRLRADFDISGFSQTNQIILKAMKQYGMILADNGSNFFFQGTPDARWNDNDLNALKSVPSSAFDVVQMARVYDSATAPTGAAPVITSFTASARQVAPGASVTLTPTVTGASYSYIDNAGFVRGSVTVNPTATTTYTLTSKNAFGSATASVTVTVAAAPTVKSITIAPAPHSPVFALTATARMSDNTTQDITATAVWRSSNPAAAAIANGQLLFQGPGITTVTAQSGSATSQPLNVQAVFQVVSKGLVSISSLK